MFFEKCLLYILFLLLIGSVFIMYFEFLYMGVKIKSKYQVAINRIKLKQKNLIAPKLLILIVLQNYNNNFPYNLFFSTCY